MMKENSLDFWLNYIQTLEPKEIELGLERIKPIYEKLIKTKISSKVIVVGGTNGKGTPVEFLSRLLMTKNKTVGTFTSPHLLILFKRGSIIELTSLSAITPKTAFISIWSSKFL